MKRSHQFNFFSALSLLLCVAAALLWLVSYENGFAVTRLTPDGRLHQAGISKGAAFVEWGTTS